MTGNHHHPMSSVDPEIAAAVSAELQRQQSTLEMIASENFAPVAVLEAQGFVLTNKYAEGYPGRRYYGGCEHVAAGYAADEIARDVGWPTCSATVRTRTSGALYTSMSAERAGPAASAAPGGIAAAKLLHGKAMSYNNYVAAVEAAGIPLYFTGIRHFYH